MEPATCVICAEKINKTIRRNIHCPYCNFSSCMECVKTFIKDQPLIRCMNNDCGKEWTLKQIAQIFPKSFITKEWKDHFKSKLYEREQSLLPETQLKIEKEKEIKRINQMIDDKIQALRHEMRNLEKQREELLNPLLGNKETPKERVQFIRACPNVDCRGFLSSRWLCQLCDHYTCNECGEVKGKAHDAEHTCNPDNVSSFKLANSETKPCPKCAVRIFKIDGCDQMWCISCHTAFSWRTGEIVTTRIHNPHYYAYVRQTGGELRREDECGNNGGLDYHFIRRVTTYWTGFHSMQLLPCLHINSIERLTRNIMEAMEAFQTFNIRERNWMARNEMYRRDYLLNIINEEKFKSDLYRNERSMMKEREINDIYQFTILSSTDILNRFCESLSKELAEVNEMNEIPHNYEVTSISILKEIDTIVQYANECLDQITHTFSCVETIILPSLSQCRGTDINGRIYASRNSKYNLPNTPIYDYLTWHK